MKEAETCPLCGALPCDWCNNPHELLSQTKQLPDERAMIVTWLRSDADKTEQEATQIMAKFCGPTKDREAEAWADLVATKRGIANAIEAGVHLK